MSECQNSDSFYRIYWKIFQCKMFHRKIIQGEKYPRAKFLADRRKRSFKNIFMCNIFLFGNFSLGGNLRLIFFARGIFTRGIFFNRSLLSLCRYWHFVISTLCYFWYYIAFDISDCCFWGFLPFLIFCSLFDIVTPNPMRRSFLKCVCV